MLKKKNLYEKICGCALLCLSLALTGCAGDGGSVSGEAQTDLQTQEETARQEEMAPKEGVKKERAQEENPQQPEEISEEALSESKNHGSEKPGEPLIKEVDWSSYFDGIDGSAVIYQPSENCCEIYNKEAAFARRSPCSTFKIISPLIALENGIIDPEDSIRTWSGESFWNEEWNRDIGFNDAFHASCVWYFREVADEIGEDLMQKELDRLSYGNCDISDWKGRLNTNNSNPALTGFWIESSLLISPKEQVEVLERIFGDRSGYSEKTREELKQVMLLPEQSNADISIYGKTGMGKAGGFLVDAWYAGFAECSGNKIYFCVHLDETEDERVSSATAREIAVKLVSDFAAQGKSRT